MRYQPPNIAMVNGKGLKENMQKNSFFISSFADDIMAKDLLKILGCYGKIVEVVVPSRRDKLGRRFGFARFIQVEEPDRFARLLDNVFVGGEKLYANLPSHERIPNQKKGGYKERVEHPYVDKMKEKEILKLKSVWVEKVQHHQKGKTPIRKEEGGGSGDVRKVIAYNAPEEEFSKHKNAMVGKVLHPGSSYHIKETFAMQGVFSIKVTPMGANLVLLEGGEDEDVQGFVE